VNDALLPQGPADTTLVNDIGNVAEAVRAQRDMRAPNPSAGPPS